jgi:AF2212-like
MVIKARYDGRVFIPQEPVDLPADSELELVVSTPSASGGGESALARLAAIAQKHPPNLGLPIDLAAQHDHYLYGTAKRP